MEKINANATILSRVPSLEKVVRNLSEENATLAERLDLFSTEVKEKTAALETAIANAAKSTEECDRLRIELDATQKQLADLHTESAARAHRAAELTERVAQLTADTETLRA